MNVHTVTQQKCSALIFHAMYLSGIHKTSKSIDKMEEKPPSVNQDTGLLKTIQQINKAKSTFQTFRLKLLFHISKKKKVYHLLFCHILIVEEVTNCAVMASYFMP